MKYFITCLAYVFSLMTYAGVQEIPVYSEVPKEDPNKDRMPRLFPIVTISDRNLIKIERISQDSEIGIEILRNEESMCSITSTIHEIQLPFTLTEGESYDLILIVDGSVWEGVFTLE